MRISTGVLLGALGCLCVAAAATVSITRPSQPLQFKAVVLVHRNHGVCVDCDAWVKIERHPDARDMFRAIEWDFQPFWGVDEVDGETYWFKTWWDAAGIPGPTDGLAVPCGRPGQLVVPWNRGEGPHVRLSKNLLELQLR